MNYACYTCFRIDEVSINFGSLHSDLLATCQVINCTDNEMSFAKLLLAKLWRLPLCVCWFLRTTNASALKAKFLSFFNIWRLLCRLLQNGACLGSSWTNLTANIAGCLRHKSASVTHPHLLSDWDSLTSLTAMRAWKITKAFILTLLVASTFCTAYGETTVEFSQWYSSIGANEAMLIRRRSSLNRLSHHQSLAFLVNWEVRLLIYFTHLTLRRDHLQNVLLLICFIIFL